MAKSWNKWEKLGKVVKSGEKWGKVGKVKKSGVGEKCKKVDKKLLVYLQQHMLVNQQQHVVLEVYRHTQHKIPPTRHTIGVSCM